MGNSNNNNITAINQSFNSPPILEFSGTFSYRSPTPLSSAPPAISNHWSAPAGAWGFTGTSSGLPYPGSNVGPPLTWPRIPSRPFQSNSPSPAVLASMSRRRRNPGNRRFMNQTRPSPASVADEQTSGFTMFPSSELSGNNAPNQVSLPRGSTMPDHGMQLWNTPESMPPEYQTDDEEEEEDDEEEEE
ncbi:uncharacterized protein LOC132273498 [Cornus florida]|uniref:uncharacterized protein LOC132273498 n=1 Tax=Cornus florida TaxID=4283 RepID=UPI0028A20A62|nr:uncharacterized protein LOC132273498 [Cornus florida]